MGIHGKIEAVFLDRDGVINEAVVVDGKPYPPSSVHEMKLINGVKEGLDILKERGFQLIVITNQPDVARGITSENAVTEIHNYLKDTLPIDDVFCCFHDNRDLCNCRKPEPGMIYDAAKKWNIDLSKSYLIGDRWRDIEAGKRAGLKTFLIDYGYDEEYVEPDFVCSDFKKAVNIITKLNN